MAFLNLSFFYFYFFLPNLWSLPRFYLCTKDMFGADLNYRSDRC